MENELVRFSRAGDIFHYRWAARRCLRLIHPKSLVKEIIIEGSKEKKKAGEYVIDVAEYLDSDTDETECIAYYQLKHTTVRKNVLFNLSDLKDTLEGFAARYSAHLKGKKVDKNITFTIVTNRPINPNFKENVLKIANEKKANAKYIRTLKAYTKLEKEKLRDFCACLKFADGEGDYNAQKHELHIEIKQLVAGTVDSPIIENITSLVRDKALPDSDGRIIREEILRYFGVTSARDLFPAPVEFEKIETLVHRKQHETLQQSIFISNNPLIIHAPGGVGKTVLARQIVENLPTGSHGIIYDCFGAGRYRNRSELRHRHRDGLVQIVNELALKDLCDPLLVQSNATEDEILRKFLERIKSAILSLRTTNSNANLVILIDAADNAEMAAKEFGHNCFVHELLREDGIEGIKLVAFCRTERIDLLQPSSKVEQLELEVFNEEESFCFLKSKFQQVSKSDAIEFHRLTNGNPRVQANALSFGSNKIDELFNNLIAIGTSVDEQITAQLNSAVANIRDKLTIDFQKQIEDICIGLATLPPFIPLQILSKIANVEQSTIKSFIAEMGRPLWLIDNSIQFRDEPTETWFRETYAASKEQLKYYIEQLKPLAGEFAYVATTIPSLLLQAGENSELVEMAISDEFLPSNPVDKRNVRIYRLQFAFKAALNEQSYADAIKLALRAGEEVAGDKRQYELLTNNIDLIAPLLDESRVQEFAFRRSFSGDWKGSENIYSASLLSTVKHFAGESRSYLRAAMNWLHLYFEQQKRDRETEDKHIHNEKLQYNDILEFVFTNLNLHGVKVAVEFLLSWKPSSVIYHVSRKLFKRLIDTGDFDSAYEIALKGVRNQQLIIAYAHELFEVGKIPSGELLQVGLDILISKRGRMPKPPDSFEDTTLLSLIAFMESCAVRKLSKRKILRVLNHFYPKRASRSIISNYQNNDREVYLRAVVLRNFLLHKEELDIDELLPEQIVKEKNYKTDQDIKEFKETIGGLIPWYQVRLNILLDNTKDIFNEIEDAKNCSKSVLSNRWKKFDIIPIEISRICSDIFIFYCFPNEEKAKRFYEDYLCKDNKLGIAIQLKLVRAVFKHKGLPNLKRDLEESAYEAIEGVVDEIPETKANWYIDLARSVINVDTEDAAVYFNLAIEAVSKFGDELVERWEAVVALANHRGVEEQTSNENAYRFIRCAELIGENVAREKYWNRNEAIKACLRLSPVTAVAALSRWLDRGIGVFEYQLSALLNEAVSNEYISPMIAWSMGTFLSGNALVHLAVLCIEKETVIENKQYILDSITNELKINGFENDSWRLVNEVAIKYSLDDNGINGISIMSHNVDLKAVEIVESQKSTIEQEKNVDWTDLLKSLELMTPEGIAQAVTLFNSNINPRRNQQVFWKNIFNRIEDKDVVRFLYTLVKVEGINIYELKFVLSNLPNSWCRKISVKREWPKILELVGRSFASILVERDMVSYFTAELSLEKENVSHIHTGIIKGLATQVDMVGANTFFGFVKIASKSISTSEATKLLNYALLRFEMHIDNDFADGLWLDWLHPPDSINKTCAGFIWSALGSPKSATRWCAVHSIRRLADAQCSNVITELIYWMEENKVNAFGSIKFPFYNLHATLYLLIALARISISSPDVLLHHSDVFYKFALKKPPHILIQKYASEIALNLEKSYPGTYTKEELQMLQKIGVSQFAKVEMKNRWETRDSYWHANGEINPKLSFNHGYDFESYWFKPLGRVFGISAEQVEDLANEIVINDWNIKQGSGYENDPRQVLWESPRNQQDTYHSHGSYPKIDDYNFYISYHAMLVVAGKLLKRMPIIDSTDWDENEWESWLGRHILTRSDGYWLYDRRDPIPLLRQGQIDKPQDKNWKYEINSEDFLNCLFVNREDEPWLNVFGFWGEGDGRRSETVNVTSALVSIEGSKSLLNALSTCSNPHDFKIPDYQEDEMEFNEHPLTLKGWIYRESIREGIDEFDPYAAKLQYPPYEIGKLIVEKMGLSADFEKRKWKLANEEKESVVCEIWSSMYTDNDEEPNRYGNRIITSLSFLKKLCLEFQCELIIEIQIRREFKENYYIRSEETSEYKPPVSKIFILSKDGKIRDTERYYEFGQDAGNRT
ncbi:MULTISPECIES: P-loop domain-containing protein [Bacillus cereus group]|uniref:ATP-binding protein n=1 Tax=Bacillus cereus group TaxID=86661 RepID=UPI0007DB10C2|nr:MULTISPECIES: ATP-binding protein [Bacillus cereus group]MCU5181427.1 ATP-binding protein [Bacillus toyonensis]OAK34656.1 hypothetical protein A6285_09015 [Bacillus wiedmannii]HDR7662879.1 ATP-binding protein [Bacillus wiedmannii]